MNEGQARRRRKRLRKQFPQLTRAQVLHLSRRIRRAKDQPTKPSRPEEYRAEGEPSAES
jgi:hypothetical protein